MAANFTYGIKRSMIVEAHALVSVLVFCCFTIMQCSASETACDYPTYSGDPQPERFGSTSDFAHDHGRKLVSLVKPAFWGKEGKEQAKPDFLVKEEPLILSYHNGPIISAVDSIPVYIIWYGTFSKIQRSTILDFFVSIQPIQSKTQKTNSPSVSGWWKITAAYKDAKGAGVPSAVHVAMQIDIASTDKSLTSVEIEPLLLKSLTKFPTNPNAFYLLLTAADVAVEGFCVEACASHFATGPIPTTKGQQLPYAWVGNSASQCPGKCAWPFARAEYGPPTPALVPPSADVGVDGMIINIATILAGTATNPFSNGFYQGDGAAPLEAATACAGMFGEGAYSGFPGTLLVDVKTGASFNAFGVNNSKFLLPDLWSPLTLKCTPPS